jgi:Aldehyde dehydrogenase family
MPGHIPASMLHSRPYWEGLSQGELRSQRFPPGETLTAYNQRSVNIMTQEMAAMAPYPFLQNQLIKLLINGQWVEAAGGNTFATLNPATGEELARVAEGGAEDINRAVAAARKAFESGSWPKLTPAQRAPALEAGGSDRAERRGTGRVRDA